MSKKPVEMELLESGLKQLQIESPPNLSEKLMQYLALMLKWNRVHNLTAITDPQEIIIKHFLDSLTVAKYLQGERFIDVGTGAGLPGIPLAILSPKQHWTLLDCSKKRCRFLLHVLSHLQLTNIDVVDARVETFQPSKLFDGVMTRAYSSLKNMIENCYHLTNDTGVFYAMKAHVLVDELNDAHNFEYKIMPLDVPYLNQTRQLVVIKKTNVSKNHIQ